jgi:putative hemolysin
MILLAIAALCALLEAVMTALEVAVGSVSRARIRDIIEDARENSRLLASGREVDEEVSPRTLRRAERLLPLLEQPEKLTLMFIIATTLLLWGAASALAWQAQVADWPVWGLPLALLLLLFVAEVLPLLLAAPQPEATALFGSRMCMITARVLAPLVALLGGAGRAASWLMGARRDISAHVTTDELRTALAAAEEEGVIESDERAMLEGAMNFREIRVREVMTPRLDMVGVQADAPLSRVLATALHENHSRLPVFDGTPDKIIGLLPVKDLIPHLRPGNDPSEKTARDLARPAFFLPQEKRIAAALEDLRRERLLMAVVVDENGGTAGLVTLEDLLEEIVGEIQDEHDEDEPLLQVDNAPREENASQSAGTANGVEENRKAADSETSDREIASRENANRENAQNPSASTREAILCDGGVSVRDARRFWKRSFGETLWLENDDAKGNVAATNATVSSSAENDGMTLSALAQQLFDRVPREGERVLAGTCGMETESGETRTRFNVFLEIVAMNGPRIERVRIAKA